MGSTLTGAEGGDGEASVDDIANYWGSNESEVHRVHIAMPLYVTRAMKHWK